MSTVYWICAFVILVEALNKLERTDLRGRSGHALVVTTLKATGWSLLAIGAGGVVIDPLLVAAPAWMVDLEHICIAAGFAVLVVRSRMQETEHVRRVESDDFERTMVIDPHLARTRRMLHETVASVDGMAMPESQRDERKGTRA